jgi:hypothetical protein
VIFHFKNFLGNLRNWWEEETKNRFLEKANCIIWQYGNYTAKAVDKNLNGINTQVNINPLKYSYVCTVICIIDYLIKQILENRKIYSSRSNVDFFWLFFILYKSIK